MRIVFLLSLSFYCASCVSQSIPFAFSESGWDKQSDDLLQERWRSFDQVELYKTTLDEVTSLYGKSERFRANTKNYSPYLQCYLSEDNNVVVFQSGPLGGWSVITGILLAEKNSYNDTRCTGISAIKKPFGIAGLNIGDDEKRVHELLGQPSFRMDNFLTYRYAHKNILKVAAVKEVHVSSGIEVGLNKGRVSWIRVYWQESI